MKSFLLLSMMCFSCVLVAQHAAVSVDKMNILYAGMDNPLTITAENCPCNMLVIKLTLGEIISDRPCSFMFHSSKTGATEVSVYRKTGKKRKLLSVFSFRVKGIPKPVFKIGPYGPNNSLNANTAVLSAQRYVRADLENFDFDARFRVDSYRVSIYKIDTCEIKRFEVKSNELPNEVANEILALNISDVIVFDKIFAKGPDGLTRDLDPVALTIAKNYPFKAD